MVQISQKVILPDNLNDDPGISDFKDALRSAIGSESIEADVVDITGLGICQILLPKGVSVRGYSHLIAEGPYSGRELVDLHQSYIK